MLRLPVVPVLHGIPRLNIAESSDVTSLIIIRCKGGRFKITADVGVVFTVLAIPQIILCTLPRLLRAVACFIVSP